MEEVPKITDMQLVDDLIERMKGSFGYTYLQEAKRLLDLDKIKDATAKEKLEKAISGQ